MDDSGSRCVRYGPYCGPILEWIEMGLEPKRLGPIFAGIEGSHWSGAATGWVDESLAVFNADEIWIAQTLAAEGHNVIALPVSQLPGTPSADAIVSGLLTEFKTYYGTDATKLLCKVVQARRQAGSIVINAVSLEFTDEVRRVIAAIASSAHRRNLRAFKVIGVDFHHEWGNWNLHFAA